MNAIVQTKPMLLEVMADKAGLRPQEFADTVRKTCGLDKASAEEFAAFIMVAKEYGLNPLLKEIYAFPAKGGGIVPVVSIDGWLNLVNSHKACDGFETEFVDDDKGDPISCTCKMYRKDRARPVVVTEYFEECKRATDPWKMKHRMLRHKAVIQAARYAFGFSGIYDEDEGAKIAEMRDVTPMTRPVPPKPPAPPSQQIAGPAETIDNETGEITVDVTAQSIDADQAETVDDAMTDETETLGDYFTKLEAAMEATTNAAEIAEVWNNFDPLAKFEGDEDSQALATKIKRNHVARVGQK